MILNLCRRDRGGQIQLFPPTIFRACACAAFSHGGRGLSRVKIKKNMRVPGARLGKFKKSAAHAPDFNEMNYLVLYQTISLPVDPG